MDHQGGQGCYTLVLEDWGGIHPSGGGEQIPKVESAAQQATFIGLVIPNVSAMCLGLHKGRPATMVMEPEEQMLENWPDRGGVEVAGVHYVIIIFFGARHWLCYPRGAPTSSMGTRRLSRALPP